MKTVKTPNSAKSESSLPTPEITGEEEFDNADQPPNAEDEGDVDDDDLEAEMMAEFEKERDWGEEPQDDDADYGDEDDDEGG